MPVKSAAPIVETNKDFIFIKIPRSLFWGQKPEDQISELEQGLQESFREAETGELHGPFNTPTTVLRSLKKHRR